MTTCDGCSARIDHGHADDTYLTMFVSGHKREFSPATRREVPALGNGWCFCAACLPKVLALVRPLVLTPEQHEELAKEAERSAVEDRGPAALTKEQKNDPWQAEKDPLFNRTGEVP